MEDKKINITVPPEYNGDPILIVWREGDAEAINEPQRFSEKVSVKSILAFVTAKSYHPTPADNTGVVMYKIDPDDARLEFKDNPENIRAMYLVSRMQKHEDFLSFGINKDRYFTQKDLEKHIRKYAHCFQKVEEAKDLIKRLQNFTVKYEQTVEKKDDRQGATKDLVETAIKFAQGEMPVELGLRCPLYYHTQPVSFTVQIEIQKGPNNLPQFGFYSMDVELLMREVAVNTIQTEVDELKNYFAVLEV